VLFTRNWSPLKPHHVFETWAALPLSTYAIRVIYTFGSGLR
jgi:hypothetical protein